MGTVYLDGERVDFQGDAPATGGEVWNALEEHLGQQGRVLESVAIDGREVALEEAGELGAFEKLEFRSVSLNERLVSLCELWLKECSGRAREGEEIAALALRSGWATSQERVISLLEGMRDAIEGFGILENFGSQSEAAWAARFSAAFAAGIAAVERVADAVESRDCVALSDRLAEEWAARWRAVIEVVEGEALPALRKEVA